MKSSDKPELSKKWWTKEKPGEIKGTDLEKALGACESALADVKKKEDSDTIQAALDSLSALTDAVDDTTKECAKKKLKDVVTVLDKFEKIIGEKTKELEKAQTSQEKEAKEGEDEDEDAKTVFKPEYLARMIKMLRGGELLQFAMGLDKHAPEQSKLVLCNKRKPERLHKMLKQSGDFANRLITFGTASGDGKILDLNLSDDAKEPSQIVKTAKEFFKGHRDLKYRKIRVHAGGETFEEEMADDAAAASSSASAPSTGDLQAQIHKAELAEIAWQKALAMISDQIAQVQRELNAFDDPDAASVHDGLSSLVSKIPDPGLHDLSQSQDANAFTSNLAKTRARLLDLQQLTANGGALKAIDDNPFGVSTNVVDTVNKAIAELTGGLA